jgi:UDP-N-acetylglucosamine 2-epimerase (non-hydrolysing)
MLYFFIGTKAQIIKMAPLLAEAAARRVPYRYIDSGQHHEGSLAMLKVFGLPSPHVWLNREGDFATVGGLVAWFMRNMARWAFNPGWIRRELFPEPGVCLVHGDTVTTLMGALFARRAGIPVVHIESGLRSGSLREPFPEELIRVLVMRMGDVLFAPDAEAEANLRRMRVKGTIVNSRANTVLDTIWMTTALTPSVEVPTQPFVVVSCHRYELIYNRARLTWLLDAIELVSRRYLVVFAVHEPTRLRLVQYGLWSRLASMPNVRLIPPQNYVDFITLERASVCVLADGGSVQEETHYMGTPCLVLRDRTERGNGLGLSAELAHFDLGRVTRFLDNLPAASTRRSAFEGLSPSRDIVDWLTTYERSRRTS